MTGRGVLAGLARAARADGGLLADVVLDAQGDTPLGDLAAAGPRAVGREADVALVVEAVHEGYLLHYGTPRVVVTDDADLALLAGDRLYALGLSRLAELGDLAAVEELADVIALCAQAHAAGAPGLAGAAWQAGARAVGWGSNARHVAAKDLARAGDMRAESALRSFADGHGSDGSGPGL
jgi:hypothetical protein